MLKISKSMKRITIVFAALWLICGSANAQTINWMTLEEAQAAAQKEPRKILIDVYTNWCGWCKRMDKTTFQNAVIAEYVNRHYYAVKLNAESKDSIVFKGDTFKFVKKGRRGYHEIAAAMLQGKMSYPSMVYLNENLEMIQPVPGYMDAARFEKIIAFFGEDHYKKGSFEDFEKEFKSKL